MKKHIQRLYTGFTLIEIIIVIAILITLTGFITANYVQYSEERKLADALVSMKTVLSLARTRAATGDIGTYPCNDFSGYEVKYDAATKTYAMKLCCNTGCTDPLNTFTTGTYTQKTNVDVRSAPFDIIFKPYARGVYSQAETVIEFKNSFIKQCNYIKVSAIGVIDEGTPYSC